MLSVLLCQLFETFDPLLACFIFLSDDGPGTNLRNSFGVSFTERRQWKMFNVYQFNNTYSSKPFRLNLYNFQSSNDWMASNVRILDCGFKRIYFHCGLISSVLSEGTSSSWHLSASRSQAIGRTDCPHKCTEMQFTSS